MYRPGGTNTVIVGDDVGLALEATLGAIKTAVELLDNFISGSRGLVTEDNSAAIKTAAEKLDDLQAALKSVDTDELISRITDSAGAEINPAKEDGNLSSAKTAVESLDTKQGTTGIAAGVGGVRAAQLRYIGESLATLNSLIGEVQADPTANTLLDRVKDLLTGVVLATGSAIIGRVGIDQTTPGTTDSVSLATGQGGGATIGASDDPAATAGDEGTLSAKLRALSRDLVANIVLATGANAIGKLAANSGIDIGDVDVPVLQTLASSIETTPTQITKTVAAIATPEALAADGTVFRKATIMGKKAARTDNVGIVYLGIGATNDTQPYPINPGEAITLEAPPGEKYDLNDWYLDVLNAGDGVIVIYS